LIDQDYKLQDIRNLFHKSFEAFPDLIFLVSHDGTYLDYLGNEKNLFVPPKEFIGKKITDIMPKNISKLQMNAIRKTFETKQIQDLELSIPIRNETRYFESRFVYFSKELLTVFVRDITKRKLAEQKLTIFREKLITFNEKLEQMINDRTRELKASEISLRKSKLDLEIKNQISNVFLTVPDEKMYGEVLSIILKTLKSKFGIFGYLDENENLVEPSLTENVWEKCVIEDKRMVFPKKLWAKNIYGRVINEKKSVYVNKFFNVPEGHVPISNFLGSPIIYDNKVIGILIVSNKETDYEEYDVKILESISNLIAPILSIRLERDSIENIRQRAEQKLKESEEKYRHLVENIPDTIYSALPDETGTTIFMSNRWKDWTGYSPEDFYKDHETWPKSMHHEDRDGTIKKYIDAFKEKTEYTLEYRVVHKDSGEIRYVRDRGVPLFDEKGYISRFDGVVSDITENKEAEQSIRKSKEKYEEAYNRMIFYQDLIAHDINNVLNVLNISSELLSRYKKDYEFGKDVNNEINRVKVQVDKGANLIRNIRKLSKLEDGSNILEAIDVNFIMEKSIEFTKKVFRQRKINCKVESVEKHLIVKANELLSDLFENILNNAVKYNDNQTVDILIKIDKKIKEKERYIKIEFNDNGIGISDTRKPTIFQKRFIKEKYSKGMGLGLSLVKKIIQSYCGIIKVKNRIKGDYTKGSRFIIYIPEAL